MRTLKGAVFDCDGTLLDSMDVWRGLEAELAARAGVSLTPVQSEEICTLTIPEVGDLFHNRFGLGASVTEVLAIIHEHMLDFYGNHAQPRPGAIAFVRALAERGIPCSVASSTPRDLLEVGLAHAGIRDCFCSVLSVDDVGHSKREPHVFLASCQAMSTQPSDTWGFEDSLYALETLRRADFSTVGIYDCDDAGTFEALASVADVAVKSFTELDGTTFPA